MSSFINGKLYVVKHKSAKPFMNHEVAPPPLWEQRILPIFGGGVGNFRLHFLSNFFFNFENLNAYKIATILNFPKHPHFLHFG